MGNKSLHNFKPYEIIIEDRNPIPGLDDPVGDGSMNARIQRKKTKLWIDNTSDQIFYKDGRNNAWKGPFIIGGVKSYGRAFVGAGTTSITINDSQVNNFNSIIISYETNGTPVSIAVSSRSIGTGFDVSLSPASTGNSYINYIIS